MLFFASLAAFGTAVCWALSPIFTREAAQHFGALRFARTRYLTVLLPMLALSVAFGDWNAWTLPVFVGLAASGLIGIFLGDTLLFAGVARLGPRLGAMIFTTAAPMTEVMNWALLGTPFSVLKTIGIVMITAGVMVAIFYGKRGGKVHALESLNGPLWIGIVIVLVAAAGQAIGTIIAKPMLDAGIDPFTASAWRVAVSVGAYGLLMFAPAVWTRSEDHGPYTPRMTFLAVLSGVLGMAIGTTLFTWALSNGDAGIVAAVASTAPLVQLPLLWVITRQVPTAGAWIGAAVAVGGGVLLVLS